MELSILSFLGYLASILMGISLGLLGGGGSILTVPILVYFLNLQALEATTSSLFIVGTVALVGGFKFHQEGLTNIKIGLSFAAPSFLGIYLARHLALPLLPDLITIGGGIEIYKATLVMGTFAILMVLASLSMLGIIRFSNQEVDHSKSNLLLRYTKTALQGVGIGFLTGFVGAGGGFLIIPALVNLVKLPMRMAIGTSLLIIAVNSLFGFSVSYLNGAQVSWSLQLTILLLALIGIYLGAKWAKKIDEKKLKTLFGIFVLIMGALVLIDQVF